MGSILGGGGGGGSGGDEANTTEKALPSPAQIAATREAFNTASGAAGVAKNLPYYAQIASSPSYRKALQNTANTWSNWMGTAPLDLSEGMAPITQGQFGSVIDAGQIMNDRIASLPPDVQKLLAQWTGPGAIQQGDAYSPAIYDPYVQQKPLLHQGSAADGGVGTIGAGGIPVGGGTGGGTPPPAGGGGGTPPPTGGGGGGTGGGSGSGQGGAGGNWGSGGGGQIIRMGGKTYRRKPNGNYVLVRTYGGTAGGQGGQGGMGPDTRNGTGFGSFGGGWASGSLGGGDNLGGGNTGEGGFGFGYGQQH